MAKKIYIQRKVYLDDPSADRHYLGEFENQSELMDFISRAILDDQSLDCNNLAVAEDQDAMLGCDYAVLLYPDEDSDSTVISINRVKAEKILHENLSYVKFPFIDRKPLLSVLSDQRDKIVF